MLARPSFWVLLLGCVCLQDSQLCPTVHGLIVLDLLQLTPNRWLSDGSTKVPSKMGRGRGEVQIPLVNSSWVKGFSSAKASLLVCWLMVLNILFNFPSDFDEHVLGVVQPPNQFVVHDEQRWPWLPRIFQGAFASTTVKAGVIAVHLVVAGYISSSGIVLTCACCSGLNPDCGSPRDTTWTGRP